MKKEVSKNGNLSMRGQIRGQTEISFGMIFSIILVIVFLAFAFYGIRIFLNTQNEAKAAKFTSDFQGDIDRVWNSQVSSETKEYATPSGVDFACFVDFSQSASGENSAFYQQIKDNVDFVNSNFAFYPSGYGNFGSAEINHIDVSEITADDNPFCVQVRNGKVEILLKKDYGENLVTIERAG